MKKAEEEHEHEHEHHHEHHHHHEEGEECHCHEHEHHHHHEDGEECHCHDHDHEHHHHHADDIFTSWGAETSVAFTKEKLQAIFDKFEKEEKGTILRSKGIVRDAQSDQWIYFDYVPGQCDIRYGAPDYTGKVVVIAAGDTEDELKAIFLD